MGGDLVAIARELYIEYTQLAQESQSVLVAGPLNALLKVLVSQHIISATSKCSLLRQTTAYIIYIIYVYI